MQAVITNAGGIRAGVASAEARQQIDVGFDELESVVARSGALTSAARLMIYSRAYHTRLLEAFHAEFPCLLQALGEDLFNHFVIEYLHHHPPHSYTLHRLAERFPAFLSATRPDAEAPPDERESWPDFIVDLATLERTFIETYDGPGSEGQSLVEAEQVRGLTHTDFLNARLVPAPCLRVLAFRYPVAAYFASVRAGGQPILPASLDTFLAMTRVNYVVRFYDLSRVQYELLTGLATGLSIEHAMIQATKLTGFERESFSPALRAWIAHWAAAGCFLRIN
jgi:hypothetical protein